MSVVRNSRHQPFQKRQRIYCVQEVSSSVASSFCILGKSHNAGILEGDLLSKSRDPSKQVGGLSGTTYTHFTRLHNTKDDCGHIGGFSGQPRVTGHRQNVPTGLLEKQDSPKVQSDLVRLLKQAIDHTCPTITMWQFDIYTEECIYASKTIVPTDLNHSDPYETCVLEKKSWRRAIGRVLCWSNIITSLWKMLDWPTYPLLGLSSALQSCNLSWYLLSYSLFPGEGC